MPRDPRCYDAFTLRWDRACAAKPIVNPLFGFFDNKLLGKRFSLKANARINNDCMNLELSVNSM